MSAPNQTWPFGFIKFSAFIFSLCASYYALLFSLIFMNNSLGFASIEYYGSDFTVLFFLTILILLPIQWLRWLLALYRNQDVADLFVENYFLPLLFGSVIFLFFIKPLLFFILSVLHGHYSSFLILMISDDITLMFLFVFPLAFLPFILGYSFQYRRDPEIVLVSFAVISLIACLDFYAHHKGFLEGSFLNILCDQSLAATCISFVAFFKGTELVVRPYLKKGFRPHFFSFAFPACIVLFIFVDIFLSAGLHILCFDPYAEILSD